MKLKSLFILLLFFYGSAASQSKEDLLVMKNIDKEVLTELDDWDYEKEMRENFEYMMKTVKTFDKNSPS